MADVNLEMIRAINKLSYFLYKLHEDNVRNSLATGINSIATSNMIGSTTDKMNYTDPISNLIKNRCWNTPNNDEEERKRKCANPKSP